MLFFCGYTMCSGAHSLDTSMVPVNNITSILIQNCIADKLFVSRNPDQEYSDSIEVWNYDTILIAAFKNNLLGGNLSFALDSVSSIRIKQREKGVFQWRTIYDIPIKTEKDLAFKRSYPFARSKICYEFAVIPVLNNNIEGNINITECLSEFDCNYLAERDALVQVFLNVRHNQTRNQRTDCISTLGGKYPIYVSNGCANYDSGSFEASFIPFDSSDCSFDLANAGDYRKQIDDFLTNKKKKIYKTFNGDIWLVNIVDAVSRNTDCYECPVHSVSWVETGSYLSTTDMYTANLLDVDYEKL